MPRSKGTVIGFWIALGFGLALGAALVWRPLAHAVPLATVLVFWATVLGQLVVPGVLLARGAGLCAPNDRWQMLGQGATLGLALQGLAMLAGRALGPFGLLYSPDAEAVAQARRAVGAGPRLLVVVDAVRSNDEYGFVLAPVPSGWLLPRELFARCLANSAIQVYEARPGGPGGRDCGGT